MDINQQPSGYHSPQGFPEAFDGATSDHGSWKSRAKDGYTDFSSRLVGSSKSVLELHLQQCVQALLAHYHDDARAELIAASDSEAYKKTLSFLHLPAPAEIPVEVVVKGNRVIVRESHAIRDATDDMEAAESAKTMDNYLGGFTDNFEELQQEYAEIERDYANYFFDSSFTKRFVAELKDEPMPVQTSAEQMQRINLRRLPKENGFSCDKEQFILALSRLMRASEPSLQRLHEEYLTPIQIDLNVLKASGFAR